ncbi:hypothetical protein [Streptomyces sp. NPDC091209]|uniref:hypothetical protein n=1 Tax=Streptomyces sp. NPDC091209 TaxID=3365974 RepID=UPI0038223DC7
MSTERPDYDATDPVQGHARGPVEDAVTGPADAGPADAADETVEGSADGTTPGSVAASGETADEGPGKGPGESTPEGADAGPGADAVEGAGEGSAKASADSPAESTGEGPAKEAVDVTVEGTGGASADGPGEGVGGGPGEDAGGVTAERTADASAEGTGEDPGEHSAEGAVGGSGDGAAEGPAESGVARDAEEVGADSAEGSAESDLDGSDAGSGGAPVGGHAQGPGDTSAESPGEGDTERPVAGLAEAAAETPAAGGVAGPGEGAVAGTAEGGVESPGEGTADGLAGGTLDRHAENTLERHPENAADGHAESTGDGQARGALGGQADGVVVGAGGGSGGEQGEGALGGAVPEIVGSHGKGAGAGGGRRRRTPAAVASVVAAVLLVGGGGAYFAATASGGRSGTPGADATPPQLALDGYTGSTAGTGTTGGTAGIAPGEPDPYGATYHVVGTLPTGPRSAHVQWAEGKVTRAEVARLAKALDLAGTPRLDGNAWTVGTTKDGAEPNLRVNADAPGNWTFLSYIPGTDNCAKGKMCRPVGSGSLAGTGPGPVSEATAEKAAAPVLKAVGQDDAKLDASQLMGRVRVVNADPVVGGLPTYGWTTGLQINVEGQVIGGSGQLKTPVEGDAYPVVGAQKTLDLMSGSAPATHDPRMGIGGCASPVPLKDRDEMPCGHPSPALRPESVTVVKATFGLAAHRANGRQALVPSWLFEVRSPGADNTYTVTHPAVDPKFLASPASSAQPSPDPTVPSSEPSSPTATRDVDVQGYTADGKDLTVSFTGGVCADYTASASESAGKVTVTVTERPWKNKICIMIAKIYEKTVRLDAPLGGREVVGTDGKTVHHGSVDLPGTSGTASAGTR